MNDEELYADILLLQNIKKNIYKWTQPETCLKVGFHDILSSVEANEINGKLTIKLGYTISKYNKYI